MVPLQGINILAFQNSLRLGKDLRGLPTVFDPLRKKHLRATPEEIVRQLWIIYFLEEINVNKRLMAVERAFRINGMIRRFDMVIFDKSTHPILLAEFKGPDIPIRQLSFDQIARYNMELHVPYSLISNGTYHYCFKIDDEKQDYIFQNQLPSFVL